MICPYCEVEISENALEAEGGCCPECGAVVTAAHSVFADEESDIDEIDDIDEDETDDLDELDFSDDFSDEELDFSDEEFDDDDFKE